MSAGADARRLRAAVDALDGDQRFAAAAAVALLGAMFLPWYEKSVFVPARSGFVQDSISAFGAVSFVEAAIFLVAAGVIALVLARAEARQFHLPGGDGTVIFGAGLWATALIFFRVFDRPDISGNATTVGIQWGFFVAFVAAGALAFAGQRIRAAQRPQPAKRTRRPPAPAGEPFDDIPTATPRTARGDAAPRAAGARIPAGGPRDRSLSRDDARLTVDDPPDAPSLRGESAPIRDGDGDGS